MNNLMNREWWIAALTRAIKTVCQTAVALIGSGSIGIIDVDWLNLLSVSALAGLVSILTSIAGLPEVADPEYQDTEYKGGDDDDL